MNILGVNIIYDEKETLKTKEDYKDEYPAEKLRKLRVYELTAEFDLFRKYRFTFGIWDIFKIHVQRIWYCWLFRLRQHLNQ
jgi:hypothetical protein